MPSPVVVLNVVGLSPSLLGDAAPKLRAFARESGGVRSLRAPLPAVTCTAQASMITGLTPREHGIVANGWFHRELQEIHFWKQSNRLIHGEKVWEVARRRAPAATCANLFWWFNMGSTAAVAVTPRPIYRQDGRKVPDCYTTPASLRDRLQAEFGPFPLFRFWGPGADITSTDWIANAAKLVLREFAPTLALVYLPHLDYALQRLGDDHPDVPRHVREVDRVISGLLDAFRERGYRPIVVSEYGIVSVRGAVEPNRALRSAGLLAVRDELGGELLDPIASGAFAVVDHQIAHVYVREESLIPHVAEILSALDGVESVYDRAAQAELRIDHPRAGDLVLVSDPDRWFAYGYWNEGREPDFARCVEIHRKPGYDPCELLVDPRIRWPALAIGWRRVRQMLGFRTLMNVVPLDPSLVRGSHGRAAVAPSRGPVLFGEGLDSFESDDPMPMESVRDAILHAMFETPPRR